MARRLALLAAAGAVLASSVAGAAVPKLDVAFNGQTASYQVLIDGITWLSSGPTALRSGGQLLTSAPGGGLTLTSFSQVSGNGAFGPFTGAQLTWNSGLMVTRAEVYSGAGTIVWSQSFPGGVTGSGNASDKQGLASAWPTFAVGSGSETDLGYLAWADCMASGHVEPFAPGSLQRAHGGSNGGVFVLFNSSGTALSVSALDNLMTSGAAFPESLGAATFGLGFYGPVDPIPAGWTQRSIMVARQGINATTQAWGDALLAQSGKRRTGLRDDFQTSYLSYWTDNGAYYYYNTQPNATYEATVQAVQAYYRDELQLPLRALQFDSWWYYKVGGNSGKGALLLWEPMPSIFPDGMSPWPAMPLALHNRYFAVNNSYVGMGYHFLIEQGSPYALPLDKEMFKYIMAKAQKWGMTLYEQDWLNVVYQGLHATQANVTAGADWMTAMGDAASELGLTIQLCMPLPLHIMQSSTMQAVTNARASGDYHPGADNWDIGLSSIYYHALGIQPSKDDFWTTTTQPGNPYSDNPSEPNVWLETIVATLSTGPYGPSDAVGAADGSLILRAIRKGDGMILKPDAPATTLESAILRSVFGGHPGQPADVTHTYVDHAGWRWHHVVAVRLGSPFPLAWSDLGDDSGLATQFAVLDYFNLSAGPQALLTPGSPYSIPTGTALPNPPASAHNVRYLLLAPVLPDGSILVGEAEKIVPMSHMRTSNFSASAAGFSASVHSANGETGVDYLVLRPSGAGSWSPLPISCPVSMGVDATLSCSAAGCTCA